MNEIYTQSIRLMIITSNDDKLMQHPTKQNHVITEN